MTCSPFAGAARQVDSPSSSGYSGATSSDCAQVSSSGSESSGGAGCGATSDGEVAALLALCHIANQPEGRSVPVKPEPAVLPATAAGGLATQLEVPQLGEQQPCRQQTPAPRARQQAPQQAQRAQQPRAGRKPRKPCGGGSKSLGSKSPAAATLGVKRGGVTKARPAQAGSPAAKRARVAPAAAARASPVVARKAGTKAAGNAGKGPKPEPKRALSIDLLQAEVSSRSWLYRARGWLCLCGRQSSGRTMEAEVRNSSIWDVQLPHSARCCAAALPCAAVLLHLTRSFRLAPMLQGCFDMRQDDAAAHMGFGKTWFKEASALASAQVQ